MSKIGFAATADEINTNDIEDIVVNYMASSYYYSIVPSDAKIEYYKFLEFFVLVQ